MQGFGIVIVAILIGLVAGMPVGYSAQCEWPVGASFLSIPCRRRSSLLLAEHSSFWCCQRSDWDLSASVSPHRLVNFPWWIWGGGAIGVVLVTSSLILVPRVGSLPWFAAVMTGQTDCRTAIGPFWIIG